MKDPLSLEEKQKLPCRIECLDDSMKLTACPTECFPLLISDSQGLIEIHISRLQLSTSVSIASKTTQKFAKKLYMYKPNNYNVVDHSILFPHKTMKFI